jgi:hypothetical protein
LEDLKGRDYLEDLDVDGRIILEWLLKKYVGKLWNGFTWLSIGTSYKVLWTRWWTFRFHERLGISLLAEQLLASQEGLCSMELVNYFITLFSVDWWERLKENMYVLYFCIYLSYEVHEYVMREIMSLHLTLSLSTYFLFCPNCLVDFNEMSLAITIKWQSKCIFHVANMLILFMAGN